MQFFVKKHRTINKEIKENFLQPNLPKLQIV